MQENIREISGESIPYLLRQIAVPPKSLWIEGTLPDGATSQSDETRYLCVVGSRRHSTYGRLACESLVAGLAGYNICIVSGLALGLDSIAHETALRVGLRTVAFPGSGLSRTVLYPRSRHGLAQRMIDSGGALISEFNMDEPAAPWMFPQRNRLMAGMCHATLVIEADEGSGTMITARHATDENREVLALPGDISSSLTRGPHHLLYNGARIARDSRDILETLGIKPRDAASVDENDAAFGRLSESERQIMRALSHGPTARDELMAQTGLAASEFAVCLSSLELAGIIEVSGDRIHRKIC